MINNTILNYWLEYNSGNESLVSKFKELMLKSNIQDDDLGLLYGLITTPIFHTIKSFPSLSTSINTPILTPTQAMFKILDLDLTAPWEVKFLSTHRCDFFVCDSIDMTNWVINIEGWVNGSVSGCTADQPYTAAISYCENGFYVPALPNSVYRTIVNDVISSDNTFSSNLSIGNPDFFYGYREYTQGMFELWNGTNWIAIPQSVTYSIRPDRLRRIYAIYNNTISTGVLKIV